MNNKACLLGILAEISTSFQMEQPKNNRRKGTCHESRKPPESICPLIVCLGIRPQLGCQAPRVSLFPTLQFMEV